MNVPFPFIQVAQQIVIEVYGPDAVGNLACPRAPARGSTGSTREDPPGTYAFTIGT